MLNNILEKWEEKTLKEICDFHNGLWTGKKEPFIECNVIRNANFTKDFKLNYDNVVKINVEERQFQTRELEYGDLILEKSGGGPNQPVGRVVIFDKHEKGYSFSNFTSSIRIKNKDILDFRFLYLYLCHCYLSGMTTKMQKNSTGIRNLLFDDYKNISVPIPNINEQQRIVGVLDEAFENIEKAKQNTLQNLNNAKELFESYLTSILINKDDWDKKKLSEVCIDFGRGRSRHRPRNDKKLYGGQYPFIQTGDIRNSDHFITEYTQTYNEVGLAQSKLWPKGTLCITIAANIAETGVLTFDACFPDSVIGCVFDETKTNIDYVEYLLQSFKAILQAEGKGSAQDNINLGTFEKQYFPFPDKSIQDEIVEKLDGMRKNIANLEQIYTQKLQDLDELKQSILQKAFNGEL